MNLEEKILEELKSFREARKKRIVKASNLANQVLAMIQKLDEYELIVFRVEKECLALSKKGVFVWKEKNWEKLLIFGVDNDENLEALNSFLAEESGYGQALCFILEHPEKVQQIIIEYKRDYYTIKASL